MFTQELQKSGIGYDYFQGRKWLPKIGGRGGGQVVMRCGCPADPSIRPLSFIFVSMISSFKIKIFIIFKLVSFHYFIVDVFRNIKFKKSKNQFDFEIDFCRLHRQSSNSTKNRVCFEIDFFLSL